MRGELPRGARHERAMLISGRPEDPLRVLGEYLLQKSRELEGT